MLISIIQWIVRIVTRKTRRKSGVNRILVFSGCLIGAIWCLRYAVGYSEIFLPKTSELGLTWWEEIFNSMAHALQTFSMDEEYTEYLISGKEMLRSIFGKDTIWQYVYGVYASVLNFIAPIAGGAIIFEILANIFPQIKLRFLHLAVWREKYYFSELNEASLALAKSIFSMGGVGIRKPVIIFTDAYIDDEQEKAMELLTAAKHIGAVCVRDDLLHVKKNRFGLRKIFLIDENENGNLQALANLADEQCFKYLKKTEVYFFVQDDAYISVEKQLQKKLLKKFNGVIAKLPILIPVQGYKNLIFNLLDDVPLYEPLIGKDKNEDGTVDLTVTILGTGHIGTEMFLASYWFGQILNCNLKINIVSQETEAEFWDKIDYLNPEIRHTTIVGDPILRINKKGDYAEPYCTVNYIQCDVKSSTFIKYLEGDAEKLDILKTDYFFVSLGTDEDNLSVSNTVKSYVGQHHISTGSVERTVIAYVIYNSDLAGMLNYKKRFRSGKNGVDIYMYATGCLQEVYSVRNVFMTHYETAARRAHENYLSNENRETRAKKHKDRVKDDYNHWASLARSMHMKYKVFSLDLFKISIFDFDEVKIPEYEKENDAIYKQYEKIVKGELGFAGQQAIKKHMELMNLLAWLEHRRWNAFMRVKGFRHTDSYDAYGAPGVKGAHKQLDLKLHPCLVECDKLGIRAELFQGKDKSNFDLLDDLSYDLYEKGYVTEDFKKYDYPIYDF